MPSHKKHFTAALAIMAHAGAVLVAVHAGSALAAPPAKPAASSRTTQAPSAQQPIQIEADRAELTDQQTVSIYTGRVKLQQGDLELAGDRLQVKRNPQTKEITATLTGSPVTAKQGAGTANPMQARANRVDYQSSDRMLVLQGDAEVVRGKDRINSETIRYNAATQRIMADSRGGTVGDRVQITIQPGQEH
jgi:lipopolysaccharide export system protein LptA